MGKLILVAALLAGAAWPQDVEKQIRDKQSGLLTGLKAAKTTKDQCRIAEQLLDLTTEAVTADLYEIALKICDQAQQIARGTKDEALLGRARARSNEIKEIQQEHGKAKAAIKTLAEKKDDPDANLAVGKFVCYFKGWDKGGLENLAKGSDPALKAAAEKELAKAEALEIAEAWWSAADDKKGPEKDRIRLHSVDFYQAGWSKLTPVDRSKIKARVLTALAKAPENPKNPPDLPAPWVHYVTPKRTFPTERFARSGRSSVCCLSVPKDGGGTGIVGPPVPARAGQKLTVSVWVLTDGNESAGDTVLVRFWNANGAVFGQQGLPGTWDFPFWSRVEKELTTPDGTVRVDFSFQRSTKQGIAYIDDVSLKDVDTGQELIENGGFERR